LPASSPPATLVLFGFVYWETATYMTARIDSLIVGELTAITAEPPEQRLGMVEAGSTMITPIKVAGLFAADGRRIAGDVESRPIGLEPDAGRAISRSCGSTLRAANFSLSAQWRPICRRRIARDRP